tara:strand:+ start:473 stop:655 length:183 start_codon:yes stop_codon:yes gene_type:complete
MTPEFDALYSATRLALLKAIQNQDIENIDEFIDYMLSLNLQHLKETLANVNTEGGKNDGK